MGNSRARGFTLIEVLVVVAIIALLISILLPSLSRARSNTRSAVCLSNLRQAGLAITMYAKDNRDFIPRGGNVDMHFVGDVHWTLPVLRQVGVNTAALVRRANKDGAKLEAIIWEAMSKQPVFHCPEWAGVSSTPAVVSYIVNAYDKDVSKTLATTPGMNEVHTPTQVSAWKHPSKIVYLADLERPDVSRIIRKAYADRNLSWFDSYQVGHLPSAHQDDRRIAHAIHLKRRTNPVFVDGHAEGVDALPRAGEPDYDNTISSNYSKRWLRMFGVDVPMEKTP